MQLHGGAATHHAILGALLARVERLLEEALRLGQLAALLDEEGEVVEHRQHHVLVGGEVGAPHRERVAQHRLGLGLALRRHHQLGQVVHRRDRVDRPPLAASSCA